MTDLGPNVARYTKQIAATLLADGTYTVGVSWRTNREIARHRSRITNAASRVGLKVSIHLDDDTGTLTATVVEP